MVVGEDCPLDKAPGGFAQAFVAIFEHELVAAGLADPREVKGDPLAHKKAKRVRGGKR